MSVKTWRSVRIIAPTIAFLTFLVLHGSAQVVLSNLPPDINWYQLRTPHFKIVYPEGYVDGSQRVANTLEALYDPVSASLKTKPRTLSVVLQNRQVVPNGFVTLAPRRSEFFTVAPQDYKALGNNDWLDLLAVHEFRHVVQFDKSRVGFNQLVYWAFGEIAQAGMAFIAVPTWYWEGDAVGIETALTGSGRGRMPSFDLAFRTSLLERGAFNYHKQYLGSFKHFIPSHYVLGYHMTTHLRNKFQYNIWEPILDRSFRYSYLPFTFSNSIKKYTGKGVVKTYRETVDSLKSMWNEQAQNITPTEFETITRRSKKVFTNYDYPQVLDDGSVIALKRGLSDIDRFVTVDSSGQETKVHIPGPIYDAGYFTTNGETLVWTEYQFDPRWEARTYVVVKSYNLLQGRLTRLTNKTRYTSAAISPDGQRIVVVNNPEDGATELRLISSNMGITMSAHPDPGGYFYSMPRWTDDGQGIVVIRQKGGKKEIVKLDATTWEAEVLISETIENLGYPVVVGDFLLYNSQETGIDNIFAKQISTGKEWQVTSSQFGSFNPSALEGLDWVYYNEFTVDGMEVVRTAFDTAQWIPRASVKDLDTGFYKGLVAQEGNPNVMMDVSTESYPIAPYPKAKGLLKIHSWGPYFGSSATEFDIGVLFRDVLSTNRGFLGYIYDFDEMSGRWTADYSFQGFYPIIDVELFNGKRNPTQSFIDTTEQIIEVNFDWQEIGGRVGLRLPWQFTSSKFQSGLSLANYVGVNKVFNLRNSFNGDGRISFGMQGNGMLVSNEFELTFFAYQKQSKRDINPRWGGIANVIGLGTPYRGDYDGGTVAFIARLFFPGLYKHHSLNFLFAAQSQRITYDNDNYWFQNQVPFPRGYGSSVWQSFSTLRSNYEFTLWNADLAMGPFLNVQRIRAELFFDTGLGETRAIRNFTGSGRVYNSAGVEIMFDFNAFRLQPLFSSGFRVVKPENFPVAVELVIGNIQI